MARTPAAVARALALAASVAAVLGVPLVYAPILASPFALPKEVLLEIAGALGLLAFGLDGLARAPQPAPALPALRPPPSKVRLVVAGMVVLAAGGLSALWAARGPLGAPYALEALGRWAAVFGLAAGVRVAVASRGGQVLIVQAATTAAAVVAAIGFSQHLDIGTPPLPVLSPPGSTFGNRNLAGEAVAAALPLGLWGLLGARRRAERAAYGAALAMELLYLAATRARGAWMGAAAGALTLVVLERRRLSRLVAVAALGVLVLAVIVAVVPPRARRDNASDSKRLANGVEIVEKAFDRGSPAVRTRLGLWRRGWAMFREAPILGVGAGNWPVVFPRLAEPGASADGVLTPSLAPRQAHNDLVQALAETGLLGLGALLGLAAATVAVARRALAAGDPERRGAAGAACAILAAILASGLTGFPLAMPATLALGGLAFGLLLGPAAAGESSAVVAPAGVSARAARSPASWPAVVAGGIGLALAVVGGERRLRASFWLGAAEQTMRRDPEPSGAAPTLAALAHADRATPGAYRVALRQAQAWLRLGRAEQSATAARTALGREPFSPNAWAALGAAELQANHPEAARASVDRSLALLHDFPFALFLSVKIAGADGRAADVTAARARLESIAQPGWPDRETSDSAQAFLQDLSRHP